jgi:signal transduction histidine kinase
MGTSATVAETGVSAVPRPNTGLTRVRFFEVLVILPTMSVFTAHFATAGVAYFATHSLLRAVFWAGVIAIVELLPVPAWKSLQVSMAFPLYTAVAFVFPPQVSGVVSFLGSSDPREFKREVRPLRALFNRSQVSLSVYAASWAFHLLHGDIDSWSGVLPYAAPVAVLVFHLCNTSLVSVAMGLTHNLPPVSIFRRLHIGNPLEFLVSYMGLGLLGVTLARLYISVGWWAVAAFVMPLLLARQMFFRTRALEEATKELQDREVVLRALSNRMAEERQDERRAIAGYLHDDLAQVLYRMALHLDISEKQLEKGEAHKAREEITALRQSRNRAMELIRALIRDLHRSPLGRAGLTQSLNSYAHEVERDTGVRMRTELEDIEMAPPVQLLCYHVAREAVMNAIKHAEASAITISLEPTPEGARLTVTDNGKGFDAEEGEPEGHYGLTMMRERAQVAGGSFKIRSAPGRGTSVTADFPTSWMVEPDGEARRASEAGARDAPA